MAWEHLPEEYKQWLEMMDNVSVWWGIRRTPDNFTAYEALLLELYGDDFLRRKPSNHFNNPVPLEARDYVQQLRPLAASWYLEQPITLSPRFLLEHGVSINIG